MIDNLVGSHVLPASTRQDIIRRSDGIPLFVEEMTKALLEAGGETARDASLLAGVPGAAGACKLTCLADGAAGPSQRRQGGSAGRRGDRSDVLARPPGRRHAASPRGSSSPR